MAPQYGAVDPVRAAPRSREPRIAARAAAALALVALAAVGASGTAPLARVRGAAALGARPAAATLLTSASVSFDCDAKMPLYATLEYELNSAIAKSDGKSLSLAVKFYPTSSSDTLAELWTAAAELDTSDESCCAGSVTVTRLRAKS